MDPGDIAATVQDVLRTMVAPGIEVEQTENGMLATVKIQAPVPHVRDAVARVAEAPGSEVTVAGGISVSMFEDDGSVHRCGWCEQRLEVGDLFVQHERAGELHASCFVDEMGMLMGSTGS